MVALVTPFHESRVDEEALKKLIDFHIQNGTSVIVPCGTTGESATLTHEEHNLVIELTVRQAAGRAKVLAGAGSNATHEAIQLTEAAEKLGADGVLHITPYYNKPTQEGLYQHFKAIAESTKIPVVLYNVPGRTAVNMLPETVARLSQISNIVGIKEASSLDQASRILDLCPPDFSVISGEDALTLPMMKLGATGVISVTANIVPKICAEMISAFEKGNISRAQEIHLKLYNLHQAMFCETNPIPVKYALSRMGLIREEYRLPLVPLSEGNQKKLDAILKEWGLISK